MNVIEIDQNNAQQYLIDESFNRPVVVDWAEWCAPCKQLMLLLEKLADEYAGAFLLAKINADEQYVYRNSSVCEAFPPSWCLRTVSLLTVLRASARDRRS